MVELAVIDIIQSHCHKLSFLQVLGQSLEDILGGTVIEVIEQNGPILNPLVSKLKNISLSLNCTIS